MKPLFPADPRERAVVVGAGIAGLTAGLRLRQRGFDVTVLEASEVVGGKMSATRRDGFTISRGANILPSSYTSLRTLIADLGIDDQIAPAVPVLAVPRGGQRHRIRASGAHLVLDGLRTGLISAKSKLLLRRMLADAMRMRSSLSYASLGQASRFDTETVAEYCARRLNDEIKDYLVEPIVRALFTSNADDVSVVDFFFAALNFVGSGLMQYTGGIDFLCSAIAARLDVRTSARVSDISTDEGGVRVTWSDASGEHSDEVAGCVIAVSGADVPGLFPQLDPLQREILSDRLRYCVTYAAHFALSVRPQESALVMPVPRTEDANLCAVTFDHNVSPTSVPSGQGLVSSYWLHDWGLTRAAMSDEDVLAETMAPMARQVPEVRDHLRFATLDRWAPAVVRSYPGWYEQVARFGRSIDPLARVQLAGDYLSASSTNACAVSAEIAAQNLERAVFGTDTLQASSRI